MAPKTALNVCEPAPNSGVLVLPMINAPAARSRSTRSESDTGTCEAEQRRAVRGPHPRRVLEILDGDRQPVQHTPRLTEPIRLVGHRQSGTSGSTSVTIAFTRGFTDAMRSRCASMTSRAENSRERIPAASPSRSATTRRADSTSVLADARLRPRDARPLRRMRPAGDRVQRQLPRLLRPHRHRALARAGDGQLGHDGPARRRRRGR